MGSIFRSEEMTLAQLFLQSDSAYACIRELGELLNPTVSAFQRKFVHEVRRCDEMERKLRFQGSELDKAQIERLPAENIVAPDPHFMTDLEAKFERLEGELMLVNSNRTALRRNLLDLTELHYILGKTQDFFIEAEQGSVLSVVMHGGLEEEKGLLAEEHTSPSDTRLMFVTGVIARERLPVFQRVLWRACRGNVFLRHTQIEEYLEDPASGNLVSKCVFILFFQGDQLRTRVKKICEGFRATLYECPETQVQRVELRVTVGNRIEDLRKVLVASNEYSFQKLREIADEIEAWLQKVTKMKAIFHTLNMFNLDVTRQCLISECWCPVQDLPHIQLALRRGMEKSGSSVPCIFNQMRTDEKPPTYFRTNEFTGSFQAIVDAYGVASYREVNPTPYTIVTFPFLFAVMFGDAGHGLLMTLFAFTLLIFQKRLQGVKNEMFSMLFSGRYLLLLMGIFSIYTGLIYNDVFSKPLNIFGSSGRPYYYGASFSFAEMENMTYPENIMYCAPVGGNHSKDISCNWGLASEPALPLWIGPCVGYGRKRAFLHQSLQDEDVHCTRCDADVIWCHPQCHRLCAPNLLITLIYMFLKLTSASPDGVTEFSVFGTSTSMANIQSNTQKVLVGVMVLCVPWMLFMKPIYIIIQRNMKRRQATYVSIRAEECDDIGAINRDTSEGERDHDAANEKVSSLATISCVMCLLSSAIMPTLE